jgi:hypothetical protein
MMATITAVFGDRYAGLAGAGAACPLGCTSSDGIYMHQNMQQFIILEAFIELRGFILCIVQVWTKT